MMRRQFETLRLFALMIVMVAGASRGRRARAMLAASKQLRCVGPDRCGHGNTRSDGQADSAWMPSVDKWQCDCHNLSMFGFAASRSPFIGMFLLLGALAPSAGCGGASSTLDAAAPVPVDAPLSASIRGSRYCEVLVAFLTNGSVRAEVWGTQGLNSCPAEQWATVNSSSIRTELSATAVVLNGPRYWVIDGFTGTRPAGMPRLFGMLEMQQLATLMVAPGAVSSMPYVERTVMRDSDFEFRAGVQVFELVAADGSVYVMQSYAQIVDAALSESNLPGLGSRLTLPSGWSYRTRTLDAELHVRTAGTATVVQDELQNTYSKLPAP